MSNITLSLKEAKFLQLLLWELSDDTVLSAFDAFSCSSKERTLKQLDETLAKLDSMVTDTL